VLNGPFSPLFGPFFCAKRAGPARLGPLRTGLGQKLKPAGSAGPARFWPSFTGPGPGRAGPARLAISSSTSNSGALTGTGTIASRRLTHVALVLYYLLLRAPFLHSESHQRLERQPKKKKVYTTLPIIEL
jgi:hypothetical protein